MKIKTQKRQYITTGVIGIFAIVSGFFAFHKKNISILLEKQQRIVASTTSFKTPEEECLIDKTCLWDTIYDECLCKE